MKKAVVFDFDYTLGDSTNGILLSVNYALEKLGYPVKDFPEIKKTIGLSLPETFMALIPDGSREEANRFRELFVERADDVMVANTQLYDCTQEVLNKLKEMGVSVGIVTTKLRYRIEDILKKFEAEHLVDCIVGAEDVKIENPNPEGLLQIIASFHLTKEEALYVGDSFVDAITAENAGVDFAGVLTGMITEEEFEKYQSKFVAGNLWDVYNYVTEK